MSLATIVSLIGATTTEAGLRVRSEIDQRAYPKGTTVTDEQRARVQLARHAVHGDWNYTIRPQRRVSRTPLFCDKPLAFKPPEEKQFAFHRICAYVDDLAKINPLFFNGFTACSAEVEAEAEKPGRGSAANRMRLWRVARVDLQTPVGLTYLFFSI